MCRKYRDGVACPVLDDLLARLAAGWRLRVSTAWHVTVAPTWGFARRRTPDCHLLYVEDGAGTYTLAGRDVPLQAGLLLFAAPGLEITAVPDRRRPPRIIPLRFDAIGPDGALWSGRPAAAHAHAPDQAGRCAAIAALHGGGALAQARQHGHLLEALAILRERAGGAIEPAPSPLDALAGELRAHPLRAGGIAAMARRVGLSPKHFIRAFRQRTGSTPHAFRMRARLDHACFLLAETRLPVADIAARLAYPDASVFSRQFRRVLAISPGRWRAAHAGAPAADTGPARPARG